MGRSAPLLSTLLVLACTDGEIVLPHDDRAETEARLAKITAKCGLPTETLALVDTDQVTVAVQPHVDYRKVDCLLEALRKAHPKLKLSFVGNEAYDTGNQQ